MMMIKQEGLKASVPPFRPGDNVRVHVRVVEGDNERVQLFDGVVIGRKGAGISETFTVRKISFGVGVERVFPVHSPRVEKIEIVRSNKVRRAKLYHLRALSGKAARLEETAQSMELGKAAASAAAAKPAEQPAAPAKQA